MLAHREWLSKYNWPNINDTIQVCKSFRDLGSTFATALTVSTVLSAEKLLKATTTLFKISRLPQTKEVKIHFVKTCSHPQAFYACESSSIDEEALRTYTSKLLQLIGTTNSLQARTLTFGMSTAGPEIDPWMHVFVRRINYVPQATYYPATTQGHCN